MQLVVLLEKVRVALVSHSRQLKLIVGHKLAGKSTVKYWKLFRLISRLKALLLTVYQRLWHYCVIWSMLCCLFLETQRVWNQWNPTATWWGCKSHGQDNRNSKSLVTSPDVYTNQLTNQQTNRQTIWPYNKDAQLIFFIFHCAEIYMHPCLLR